VGSTSPIIHQIENTVQNKYFEWNIGQTSTPHKRKAELGNPLDWLQWDLPSGEDASRVVMHFIHLGMKTFDDKPNEGETVYIILSS